MRRDLDLLAVALAAMACAVVVAGGVPLLRIPAALALVLFLPGYALQALLLQSGRLAVLERLLVSVGISLALTILCGLLLNQTPAGLTSVAWAALLSAMVMLAALGAWLRRLGWGTPERLKDGTEGARHLALPRFRQAAWLTLALIAMLLAFGIARQAAAQPNNAGFTQLWMVPDPSQPQTVVDIGVTSQETATTSFRLVLTSGNNTIWQWPALALQPGQTWSARVGLPAGDPAQMHLQAVLYLSSVAYRRVAW